ncbi:MAG: molybdopterin molybdotransferase MoeA [Negativicutes bacterium]|nr:molybdopterin molybdotransferase MoeA [Negativicutes bacterium]
MEIYGKNFVSWEEARRIVEGLAAGLFRSGRRQTVPVTEAAGQIIDGAVTARMAVPGFVRATVDGYAVRVGDTVAASDSCPAVLRVAGQVAVGEDCQLTLAPGQAAKVATGAMLPAGADGVAMEEDCWLVDVHNVALVRPVNLRENLIQAGEDCREGEALAADGCRLGWRTVAAMIAAGIGEIAVRTGMRAAIFSTGDELVPAGRPLFAGQVYDVNGFLLRRFLTEAGWEVESLGIIADCPHSLAGALERAVALADLVLFSGGSSVGSCDLSAAAVERAGGEWLFNGVAVRPGRPTMAARINGKPVFCLPGHPLAMAVTLRTLLQPLFRRDEPLTVPAKLDGRLTSEVGRDDFVPVRLTAEQMEVDWRATPLPIKSGLVVRPAQTAGLVHVPAAATGYERGERVWVIPW